VPGTVLRPLACGAAAAACAGLTLGFGTVLFVPGQSTAASDEVLEFGLGQIANVFVAAPRCAGAAGTACRVTVGTAVPAAIGRGLGAALTPGRAAENLYCIGEDAIGVQVASA